MSDEVDDLDTLLADVMDGAAGGGGEGNGAGLTRPVKRGDISDNGGTWHVSSRPAARGSLSELREAELATLFERFDHDRSGSIDLIELRLLLSEMGVYEDAAALLAKLDADGSGAIEWCELRGWWAERIAAGEASGEREAAAEVVAADGGTREGTAHHPAIARIFARYDLDGGGELDIAELRPLLVDLGVISPAAGVTSAVAGAEDSGWDDMDLLLAEMELSAIDSDGNGACSLEELCAWWRRTGRGPPPAHLLPAEPSIASTKVPASGKSRGAPAHDGATSQPTASAATSPPAKSSACLLL